MTGTSSRRRPARRRDTLTEWGIGNKQVDNGSASLMKGKFMSVRTGFGGWVLGMAVVVTMVAGCSSTAGGSEESSPVPAGTTSQEACDHFARGAVPADAPVMVVVADRSSSTRALSLPPELLEVVAAGQQDGAVLQVVGVDAEGIEPWIGSPIALDPAGSRTSRSAQTERTAALGCVSRWIDEAPPAEGSDIIAAMGTALRQEPTRVVALSDGVNRTSVVDLASGSADVRAARAQMNAAVPQGTTVSWFHLGETSPPLSGQQRSRIAGFWTDLIGPGLVIEHRVGSSDGEGPGN